MDKEIYTFDTNGIIPPNHSSDPEGYSYSQTNVWNKNNVIEQDNGEFELLKKELREIKQILSEIKNSLGVK